MTAETGKLIALQDADGQVYMGYVTAVRGEVLDVDVIADNTYRTAPSPVGADR